MKKKIAFIATGYILKYDGISVYTENLLREFLTLLKQQQRDWRVEVYLGKSVEALLHQRVLSSFGMLDLEVVVVEDRSFGAKMFSLYRQLLKRGGYDLIFATNFMPLTLPWSHVVKVIHDLSPEINPHLYSRFHTLYHAMLLRSGSIFDKAIGYISQTTKRDLERFYGIEKRGTPTLYLPNGVPFKVRNTPRPSDAAFEKKFTTGVLNLLVVGRLNRAKGVDRILAFCAYFDRYLSKHNRFQEVNLHFTGKQTKETTALFEDANFAHVRLFFDGFVDDATLNRRYQEAHFCLFLSRNEGYGLPLVEAMWLKAIPLLSDIEIFKEIMQEGYFFFGKKEGFEKEMSDFIVKIYFDQKFRQKIAHYLQERVAHEKEGYQRGAENLVAYIDRG